MLLFKKTHTRFIKHNCAVVTCILFILLFLSSSVVSAQSPSESEDSNLIESQSVFEHESGDETVIESESSSNPPISFESIVPFAQYVEYVYSGDEHHYPTQSLIMEFSPDANGTFQTVTVTGNNATAKVYQINESGLYELASFDNYTMVEDLRYSEAALDSQKSLLLPRDISVGLTYQSGFNNESNITVQDIIDVLEMNGVTYYNVVKLSEVRQNSEDSSAYNHYLAPDNGIIAVEYINSDGSVSTVLQLLKVDGYVGH